ncbi:apoptosis-inducing factor 3-like isoform X1 [Pseudopipra pipra]|uniref:apoptosis-inducing factor 3-like isoform X1 n=1 Tax=Pseudopipra pipra TaxID=415032 RepID=UPI0031395C79
MDSDDTNTVTAEVCREDDVGDGELLEVMVAGYPVLLVRNRKEFSALGSKCPHYGAPLSKGVLRGERLRCPWHGACFNIRTGDIEEYPSLDCISCFKVTVEDGKVFVTAKKKDLENSLRVKDRSRRCLVNQNTMLLLGGGVAALVCAETLRQEGFTGRIIMATKEKHVPYDKSKLSKEMDLKAEDIYLRKPEFLDAQGIEFWTEKEAVSVDFQKQQVHFMDGSSQKYHQLLIATGSHSSFLKVPGADLQNVCVLQTPEDSSKILELATGKNLVIVGASFVGMEVAAFLSDKAGTISVVEREEFPFQHALGPQVGGVAMKMLQNKGVKFHMKSELCELKGKYGKVTEAVLANGEKLPADVVVVGIGSTPSSAFLKGTSIARDDKGAILVDLHMQTNIPNVFAAGDVVSFPVALLNGDRSSIHHQQVAEAHGESSATSLSSSPGGGNGAEGTGQDNKRQRTLLWAPSRKIVPLLAHHRSRCCLKHAEEREGVAHHSLLLDHVAWEKHPLCRLWKGIHRHCCQGQPGATEVPDLLPQGWPCDSSCQPELRPHGVSHCRSFILGETNLQRRSRGL